MNSIQTIVVPYDFTDQSNAALKVADRLAQQFGADLHLLHVLQPLPYSYAHDVGSGSPDSDGDSSDLPSRRSQRCIHRLDNVALRCGTQIDRIHVHTVEATAIARSIDAEAERLDADLIAMGTHGRVGLSHLLMGSVAEETLRRAPCPVLAVPCGPTMQPQVVQWEASRHRVNGSL
jgi:universal stress protein A